MGGHQVDPPLNAPATSEAILRAITAVQAGKARAMIDRDELRDDARGVARRRRGAAVVVEVVAARGSVPRDAGTRMLVVGRGDASARSAAAISS